MLFSPSEKTFYHPAYQASYIAAGTWPDDLVEVDENTFQTYGQDSPPPGKRLAVAAGLPAWEEIPKAEPSARRAAAVDTIDRAAGDTRTALSSDGALVSAEYEQARAQAADWDAAGRPADAVPADVQSWADATGNTASWAADDILAMAAAWTEALSAIRRIRLMGKEAIRVASDDSDFRVIAAPYIEQLKAIAAAA